MRPAALAFVGALLCGCGAAADTREPLVVLAAASLTATVTELEAVYEREHADVDVRLSFAGSQVLVSQLREGAPADVVVTADEPSLQSVAALVDPPVIVARNRLAIVTAPGDPLRLTSLAALARPRTTVVLAGPTVPVGRAARAALAAAGVTVRPASEEPDARAVVARVRLGEADAGIAYATDLQTPDVSGTPLPGTSNSYPAAVVRDAAHRDEGARFVAFLRSPQAQAVLAAAGYLPP